MRWWQGRLAFSGIYTLEDASEWLLDALGELV